MGFNLILTEVTKENTVLKTKLKNQGINMLAILKKKTFLLLKKQEEDAHTFGYKKSKILVGRIIRFLGLYHINSHGLIMDFIFFP